MSRYVRPLVTSCTTITRTTKKTSEGLDPRLSLRRRGSLRKTPEAQVDQSLKRPLKESDHVPQHSLMRSSFWHANMGLKVGPS